MIKQGIKTLKFPKLRLPKPIRVIKFLPIIQIVKEIESIKYEREKSNAFR